MNSWILVVSLSGFMLALGRFLEKHHGDDLYPDAIRSFFVRIFLAIDSFKFPNFEGWVVRITTTPLKQIGFVKVLVLIALGYLALTTSFYFYRVGVGNIQQTYLNYVLLWLVEDKFGFYLAVIGSLIFWWILTFFLCAKLRR